MSTRLLLIVAFGVLAGITALLRNSALTLLGLVPLALMSGVFAAATSEKGAVVDIARALGVAVLGLAVATIVVLVPMFAAPNLGVTVNYLRALWVGGGFVVGAWLLLGVLIRLFGRPRGQDAPR